MGPAGTNIIENKVYCNHGFMSGCVDDLRHNRLQIGRVTFLLFICTAGVCLITGAYGSFNISLPPGLG